MDTGYQALLRRVEDLNGQLEARQMELEAQAERLDDFVLRWHEALAALRTVQGLAVQAIQEGGEGAALMEIDRVAREVIAQAVSESGARP